MVGLFLEFLYVKVNTTIRLVSIPVRNDLLDELHNLRHVLADTCDHLRETDVKSLHVVEELSLVFTTDGFERDVGLDGFADDFVVDICDVHN